MGEAKVVSLTRADGSTVAVTEGRRPGQTYGKSFMIVFLDAMEKAAAQIASATTLKLLMRLPRHLNYTDFRSIRQVQLAEEIGVTHGAISVSMRELLGLGLLERKGSGPRQTWRLSTEWGWNGTADQYHAFRNGRAKGKEPPANRAKQIGDCRRIYIMEFQDAVRLALCADLV